MNAINPIVLPGKSFDLNTFTYNGHTLRTVTIDGKPWFVAVDVCRALGVYIKTDGEVSTTTATRDLDADERGVPPNDIGGRRPIIVSESGLYKIAMRARRSNPAARDFQDWVTQEVLPRIRRDGAYIMGEEKVATGASPQMPQIRPHSAIFSRPISP